tara:strand:- start:137 stop:922 length:786 start_codon:yes stop_codon:yes gene_type:complete
MPKIKKNVIPTVEPPALKKNDEEDLIDKDTDSIKPESINTIVDSKKIFTNRGSGIIPPQESIEEPAIIDDNKPSKTGVNGRSKKPLTSKQQEHLDFMREKAAQARELKREKREEEKSKKEKLKEEKEQLKEQKKLLIEKRKQEEEFELLKEQEEINELKKELEGLSINKTDNKIEEQRPSTAPQPRASSHNEQNGTLDIQALITQGIQEYDCIRKQRKKSKIQNKEIQVKEQLETNMIRRKIAHATNKPYYDPYGHCFNFN